MKEQRVDGNCPYGIKGCFSRGAGTCNRCRRDYRDRRARDTLSGGLGDSWAAQIKATR